MDSSVVEFTPRPYQIELFEIALQQNVIVYLKTGSGKTFIAVLLLKELSADIRRPYNEGGKRTVFAVNKVSLTIQQCEYISRLTGLSCCALSGDIGVDMWNNTQWNMILQDYQVLVMTCQILIDALNHGYIHLNRLNLIIFDECHSAVSDHPMRQIMMHFNYCSREEQPKILGLSATILNSNVKLEKLESVIESLEVTFHATVITTANEFGDSSIAESLVQFDDYIIPDVVKPVISIIENINKTLMLLNVEESVLNTDSSIAFRTKSIKKKLQNLIQYIEFQISDTGIYGANLVALFCLIKLQCKKKQIQNEELVPLLEYVITEVTKCRKLFDNQMKNNTEVEKVCSYTSDKIQKLCMILKEQYNNIGNDRKFCCIIFVHRRDSACVLYHILKNLSMYDEEYNFLKVEFIVGENYFKMYINGGSQVSKRNKEIVHRFRSGVINCIVSTNIVEEGIDIPACSLVIGYDFPVDVRAYVQSRGRVRYTNGKYILLLRQGDLHSIKRYNNYKVIEQGLRKHLKHKVNQRCPPTEERIKNELYKCEIEPYIVMSKAGQQITLTEQRAVSLINIYCSSLCKSLFASVVPIWKLYNISGTNLDEPNSSKQMFKVSLKLPIVSPLKTVIFGDAMTSVNNAKRSAAMKTCIELHKINELSDILMPHTWETLQNHYSDLFPNWIDDDNTGKTAIIGTYKKKRHHKLKSPSALFAAFPLTQQALYLHILHIKPNYFASHDDNRLLTFYNLLNNRAGFCILSTKKMPEIPTFPIFLPFGELNVDVEANYSTTHLCAEQITYIKTFHTLVFSEIIPVIKPFMIFDNHNCDNCFLVAPVDENFGLNWDVIKQYNCIKRVPPPDPFHCKAEDYELSLVIPTYRAAEVYIVTQVCDNIRPISCFPTDNFVSYFHYYKEKHGLVITKLSQPMLEVKAISNKINYITPRRMQVDFTKRKQAEFQEHLVPELCSRIDFPAVYWLKATILPSILHRVSQVLIAEDLRKIIAMEAKLGTLSDNNKWPPLIVIDEETEEPFELASESSFMENVNTSLPQLSINRLETDVLNKEDCHCPSPNYEEVPYLYDNLEEVQLIQIEHYCQFMDRTHDNNKNLKVHKKVNFKNKPVVSVPPLEILLLENSSGPNPVQIIYALTTTSAQDAFNLERFEILGDSYLKFIISLFLYQYFPRHSEGHLTVLKGKIIGNRNLYYCGSARNIPGYMKVDNFVPLSNFIAPAYTVFRPLQTILLEAQVSPNVLFEIQVPPNEQLHGHISETTKNMMHQKVLNWVTAESQTGVENYLGIQTVSDKSVADCVEALIGVYLSSMGIKNAAELLKWLQVLPNDVDINSLLHTIPSKPTISDVDINHCMPWASDIETKIGYKFKNRQYLLQAFTHPSYTGHNITECYQRLEFLGDALLDFLITCYIYTYCGNISPGTLTDLRSALVNNITLACLSVQYGLHTALLFYAPELNQCVDRFVKFQEERDYAVNDELLWILLEEGECNMSEYVDVPKALGDIFESLIGAIYLDSNKNLTIVWETIYSMMYNEVEQFSKNIPKQAIRVLHETQGAHPQFLDAVVIKETNTVMVPLKVTVAGTVKLFNGFGANKKQAKRAAAKQALKNLLSKT